jgi:hypothetical protein
MKIKVTKMFTFVNKNRKKVTTEYISIRKVIIKLKLSDGIQ